MLLIPISYLEILEIKMKTLRKLMLCVVAAGFAAPAVSHASELTVSQAQQEEFGCWTRYGKFTTYCAAKTAADKLSDLGFQVKVYESDCGCYYFVDYRH